MYRRVPVTMFGKTRMVPVTIYFNERQVDDDSDQYDEVFWVERGEDWYGLHHRRDKRILIVRREDWISAMDVGSPEFIINEWNCNHETGTAVDVTRDNGSVLRTVTRSHAWILGDNPVVMVKGISGCYLLSRVRPVSEPV